jgi:polar amino acid transport system permease protein
MSFDPTLILDNLPEILSGIAVTILMWIGASLIGLAAGFALAVGRHFGGPVLAAALRLPIEVIRGTPFLIQIFLLYYGGPFIGLALEPVPAGLLGLSVYGAAYFAEIIRGGLAAVPRGHLEAAVTVGLSRRDTILRIMVPEIALLVLPATVNFLIILMKETAVLSIITVPELTLVVTGIGSAHFAFVEATFLLAVGYWAIVEATGLLAGFAERRLARFKLA